MNRCGKCTLPVYFAESIQAIGKHFHRHCFTCSNVDCGRGLDSRNCCDHDGKPFCVHCHRLLFGPKGVGYGVGAGILSSGNGTSEYKTQYGQDKSNPVTASISYGVTRNSSNGVSSSSVGDSNYARTVIVCPRRANIAEQFYVPETTYSAASAKYASSVLEEQPRVKPFSFNQSPKKLLCGKCSKTVYEAEKIIAAGSVWHKNTCFVCTSCNKRLESRTMCERQGELHCNNCYARQFGPKGYGHGIGAGTLQLHQ